MDADQKHDETISKVSGANDPIEEVRKMGSEMRGVEERRFSVAEVMEYGQALAAGLGRTSRQSLASAWLVGERVGVMPRLGDYEVMFSDYVESATVNQVVDRLDDSDQVPTTLTSTPYRRARALGERLADVGPLALRDLALYLFEPAHFTREDRQKLSQVVERMVRPEGFT